MKVFCNRLIQIRPTFFEPGIDDLICKYKDKSFFYSSSVPEDILFDYVIISVGTPYNKKNS